MNDIVIGSLEEWDSIINYYRPNGSSKTWYLKELKSIRIPIMWGEWNVFTEQHEMFSDDILKEMVTPKIYNGIINFMPIDKIDNINHLYLITVYTPAFFHQNGKIGFSCISEKYKRDIREGRCKIVMTLLYEGHSGSENNHDLEMIETWRIKEDFPVKSVYFITGNLIGDKICDLKKLGITVLPIHMFEPWNWSQTNPDYSPPVQFNPIDEKYLYLSYNRQPRIHRVYFIHEIIRNNLFNDGLISLNTPLRSTTQIPGTNAEIMEEIFTKTPFKIDEKYDIAYNLACNLVVNDYQNTFISVISETLVYNDCLFLSEKIWKPIIMGHPFMVHGNKGTLEYLKNLGYKTFGKWIDESYDNEDDYKKRAEIIINELLRFKKCSIDELKIIREEMMPICQYNKNRFIYLMEKNYDSGINLNLKKYIESIWCELNNIDEMKKRLI